MSHSWTGAHRGQKLYIISSPGQVQPQLTYILQMAAKAYWINEPSCNSSHRSLVQEVQETLGSGIQGFCKSYSVSAHPLCTSACNKKESTCFEGCIYSAKWTFIASKDLDIFQPQTLVENIAEVHWSSFVSYSEDTVATNPLVPAITVLGSWNSPVCWSVPHPWLKGVWHRTRGRDNLCYWAQPLITWMESLHWQVITDQLYV